MLLEEICDSFRLKLIEALPKELKDEREKRLRVAARQSFQATSAAPESMSADFRVSKALKSLLLAMVTPLMAAGGYAATAYFYNLGRYKFDAEQRQDCIYQVQNMRLAPPYGSL